MPSQDTASDYDRTVHIVRNAIPRMAELKIPITPANYAVWYEYLTASDQALRDEMEILLARGGPITNAEMQALHERYLEERSEKVQYAKRALGQFVSTLMAHIERADGHFAGFSTEMNSVAEELSGEVSSEGLNRLIDRTIRATNTVLERGAEMKQQFSQLAGEVQQVRDALARSQTEARLDPLTGLSNRLAFQEAIDTLPTASHDDSHAPCLLLVDLDFFKKVNDTWGHLAGDHVLKMVAQMIRESVPELGLVARYGGEELVVLLRDTPRSDCEVMAEDIRRSVQVSAIETPAELGLKQPISVTVSVGGAWYRSGEPIEAFVDRADSALYQSKEGGRNRVTWRR